MKRIIMSMLLVVAVAGFTFAQEAQPQQKPTRPQMTEEQKEKMKQQQELLNIRLQIIKDSLKLTDEQYEKFAPIYREYNKVAHFCHVQSEKLDMENATKREINAVLKTRLDNTINMAMVRKTYILRFEEAIAPRQLMKLYKLEDELIKKAREVYTSRQSKQ